MKILNDYMWWCIDTYGKTEGSMQYMFTVYVIEALVIAILLCFSLIIALALVKLFLKLVGVK